MDTLDTDRYKIAGISKEVNKEYDVYYIVFHALNKSQAESLVDLLKKDTIYWQAEDKFQTKKYRAGNITVDGVADPIEKWKWQVSCALTSALDRIKPATVN